MTRSALSGLVLLALGIATTACSPARQVAPPSSASGSGTTIELTLKEYSITPKAISAHAGQRLTIVALNAGTMSHALTITGNGVTLSTKDLTFDPGTSETITATVAAGTYTYFCPVDGHRQLGMEGTLTVTP